jgi:hypothetical protein
MISALAKREEQYLQGVVAIVPEHHILFCLTHRQAVPKRDASVGSEDTMVRRT